MIWYDDEGNVEEEIQWKEKVCRGIWIDRSNPNNISISCLIVNIIDIFVRKAEWIVTYRDEWDCEEEEDDDDIFVVVDDDDDESIIHDDKTSNATL